MWTTREIADRFRVDARTVTRWIGAGRLPATRVGGQWRVDQHALEAFVAAGALTAVPLSA